MVRKTFGRGGQPLIVGERETGQAGGLTVIEADAVDAGTERTIIDAPGDGGNLGSAEDYARSEDSGVNFRTFAEPTAAEPSAPKRRGRPAGSRNGVRAPKEAKQNITLVTANLEKVLFNLHLMGAAMLNEPELMLDRDNNGNPGDESKLLAEAVAEVATAYDFTSILNPKTQALVDLGIACATVYGGRITRIMSKSKRKPATIHQMPQSPVVPNGAAHETPLQ